MRLPVSAQWKDRALAAEALFEQERAALIDAQITLDRIRGALTDLRNVSDVARYQPKDRVRVSNEETER